MNNYGILAFVVIAFSNWGLGTQYYPVILLSSFDFREKKAKIIGSTLGGYCFDAASTSPISNTY